MKLEQIVLAFELLIENVSWAWTPAVISEAYSLTHLLLRLWMQNQIQLIKILKILIK